MNLFYFDDIIIIPIVSTFLMLCNILYYINHLTEGWYYW